MPVYLYWGDDRYSLQQAVKELQQTVLDRDWMVFNYHRFPAEETIAGLNQAMTPPMGSGDCLVWLDDTALIRSCPDTLYAELERTLKALPAATHLLLTTANKPDARLKSTKAIKKVAQVREFRPLTPWDTDGLAKAVADAAQAQQLQLSADAAQLLAEAVGTDRRRLVMEVEKLALFAGDRAQPISADQVQALVPATAYNSFQLAAALRQGQMESALDIATHLLDANEPALRINAILVGQFRVWLWVKVLTEAGIRDTKTMAREAGIGNPNRVYFLQKEVRSLSSSVLYQVLHHLLQLDYQLKRGQDERRSLQTTCIQITQLCGGGLGQSGG